MPFIQQNYKYEPKKCQIFYSGMGFVLIYDDLLVYRMFVCIK